MLETSKKTSGKKLQHVRAPSKKTLAYQNVNDIDY